MSPTLPVREPVNPFAVLCLHASLDRAKAELARRGLLGGGK